MKNSTFELSLIQDREKVLEKLKKLFEKEAIEAHIFGSLARGTEDAYSDIDIWFTFEDDDIEEILNNRLEYYNSVGEVLQVCEPPQNAPINGVHSSIIYKTESGYVMVDFYLCPNSTSFITTESQKLFGINLPLGTLEYNYKKVNVSESYRIDFFIIFIIVALKKLLRKENTPFNQLFEEYNYLSERYEIPVEIIENREYNFNSLKDLTNKVKKVANEKQQKMLLEILGFIKKVEK